MGPPRVTLAVRPQRPRAALAGRRGMCAEAKPKAEGAKAEAAAPEAAGAQQQQQQQQVPMVVTAIRGAKTTATGALWVGIAGLTAVCGYLIVRELAPTRMSPNGVFNDALSVVQANEHVRGWRTRPAAAALRANPARASLRRSPAAWAAPSRATAWTTAAAARGGATSSRT